MSRRVRKTLTLDREVVEWLETLPGTLSESVNAILRAELKHRRQQAARDAEVLASI